MSDLELLIHTSDTFYRDPKMKDYDRNYDLASNVKQGYLQAVKPIGSPWGKLELDPKRFIRVIIPELHFNPEWLNHTKVLDSDKEIIDTRWRFPLEKFLSVGEFEALRNITYNVEASKLIPIIKSTDNIGKIVELTDYNKTIPILKLHGSAGDFDVEEDGGGDYTSLKTAIETEASDISGGSIDARFFINLAWDNADTNNWDIDGWTMGTNRMLIQTTGVARSSDGTYNDNGTRHRITGTTEGIDIETSNVTIDGLQFQATGDADNSGMIAISTAGVTSVEIDNCIIDAGGFVVAAIHSITGHTGTVNITNYVGYNSNSSNASEGFYSNGTGTYNLINCTIYGFNDGVEQDSGTVTCLNCLVFNNATDFDGTITATYCASDDAKTGTGNFQITQTASDYAALVTDANGGDFSITDDSSELYDSGTASGAPSDDIIGNTRTTDDIGAFAYVSAGTAYTAEGDLNPTGELNRLLHMNRSLSGDL